MALVPTDQNLIRDIVEVMKTRGLRLALHSGATASDEFKLARIDGGGTLPNVAGKSYFYMELDDATLTSLDEKGFGSIHPHVPDPTRQ